MKVVKLPKAPSTTEVQSYKQRSTSIDPLAAQGQTGHNGSGEKSVMKTIKKEPNGPGKSGYLNGAKKEEFAILGAVVKKKSAEELRQKKDELEKYNHFHKDSVSVPGKSTNNIKITDDDGFDSDISSESDTDVNFWANCPNMRGGGKLPDETK